ncbi:MAG: DUF305 domain-containing protein [Micropruina sp.]|uniref:DUF305 domain-containing protein n=1 Tax=Micropruina sp. TaxID=2737536 RepID=UPI0039E631EB
MRALVRLAFPLVAGLALAGCRSPAAAPSSAPSASATASSTANAADVMFTQMMIPHHEQAVVMSDAMLAKQGISAEVTTLATQIKNAQQPEIDQMRGWLTAWGASEHGDHHGHTGIDGMLSDQELDALKAAQGKEAEKLFLTGMIQHHEGAIAMAKEVQAKGSDPDLKKLADAIVTSQQAEIDQMTKLLEG